MSQIKNKPSLLEDFGTASGQLALNAGSAQNSVVRIYVLYETLGYVESVEVARAGSMLTLAANVGGILSLFLGVSVLSLFELVEVLIKVFFIYVNGN